jgi:hypothetical protein
MKTALEQYDTYKTNIFKKSYFNTCVDLMDDDLRKALASGTSRLQDRRDFLVAYSVMHKAKFGKDFVCS